MTFLGAAESYICDGKCSLLWFFIMEFVMNLGCWMWCRFRSQSWVRVYPLSVSAFLRRQVMLILPPERKHSACLLSFGCAGKEKWTCALKVGGDVGSGGQFLSVAWDTEFQRNIWHVRESDKKRGPACFFLGISLGSCHLILIPILVNSTLLGHS